VLAGASDAWKVVDEIRGRVAGVLLSHDVTHTDPRLGMVRRNIYADMQSAGIPVAFHSNAEEGAADLPLMATYAVSRGMSVEGAVRALTSDAAEMLSIDRRVGRLAQGLDADVLLLDGPPLDPSTSVLRVWVNGREIR
jgi:imidazolonepropionase-like amidohydrolase